MPGIVKMILNYWFFTWDANTEGREVFVVFYKWWLVDICEIWWSRISFGSEFTISNSCILFF